MYINIPIDFSGAFLYNILIIKRQYFQSTPNKLNMDFNEFCNSVRDGIADHLPEYDISCVEIRDIRKNNDVVCTGVLIMLEGASVSPNIYLDYYYRLYQNGTMMSEILAEIADEFRRAESFVKEKQFEGYKQDDFEHKVFLRLVNYEKNKELLADCPHLCFEDLAICFRYLAGEDRHGVSSTLVKNRDIDRLGLSLEELYKMAEANTRRIFPVELVRLDELLKRMSCVFEDNPFSNNIYVLTNRQNVNGATCLLFRDVVEGFAKKHDTSFYVLPASVHEVMFVPVCEQIEKENLEAMVREINEYVVSDMDFLSNHVYYYDKKAKKLTA